MLRHALSDMFLRGDFYGPKGETFSVTVSEVRVSPDLRNATIFFMPLGGKDKELVLKQLSGIAPYIRSLLSKAVELRFVPALYFKLDDSFENAAKVDALLKQ